MDYELLARVNLSVPLDPHAIQEASISGICNWLLSVYSMVADCEVYSGVRFSHCRLRLNTEEQDPGMITSNQLHTCLFLEQIHELEHSSIERSQVFLV